METFECIEKRKSIRKFLDTPVEWEKIGNILRAGQQAPNSGNLQDYKFVVVSDKKKIKEIAEAALQQYWIATAPIIIVVYTQPIPTTRMYGLRGEKLYSIQNSASAIENMLLAATDQKLGSCWVGAFDENRLNEILGSPDNARPQSIIPIGYPAENPKKPDRHPIVDVVYINSWKGKLVNIDLVFDDWSEVVKKKILQAKEVLEAESVKAGESILSKGKEKAKELHENLKKQVEARKKRKDREFLKKYGDDEEEILEDISQ